MDLERELPGALADLATDPPSGLVPAAVESLARRRLRRQRGAAAGSVAAVVAVAAVAVANYQPRQGSSPRLATTPGATPSASASASNLDKRHVSVQLSASGPLSGEWVKDAVIPYGSGDNQVGLDSSTGACGDHGCGPDSTAPSESGTWWVYDTVKSRLVEFAVDGTVRHVVPLPTTAMGMSGIRVLSDGTVVGDRGGDQLVVVRGGKVSVLPRPTPPAVEGGLVFADDGFAVFAEDSSHAIHRVSIDLDHLSDEVAPTRLRDGTPYTAAVNGSSIYLSFGSGPDRLVQLDLRAANRAVEYVSFEEAVDATGVTLAVVGLDRQGHQVGRLIRVDRDGAVTDEALPYPSSAARTSEPALRTTADGVTALSWADAEGLHLYHRLVETLPTLPPPPSERVAAAEPGTPAEGICGTAPAGPEFTVRLGPDGVPDPRCAEDVRGEQTLRVVNDSWFTRIVRLGRYELDLGPGDIKTIPARFDSYLARGLHTGFVYGSGGNFDLLVGCRVQRCGP